MRKRFTNLDKEIRELKKKENEHYELLIKTRKWLNSHQFWVHDTLKSVLKESLDLAESIIMGRIPDKEDFNHYIKELSKLKIKLDSGKIEYIASLNDPKAFEAVNLGKLKRSRETDSKPDKQIWECKACGYSGNVRDIVCPECHNSYFKPKEKPETSRINYEQKYNDLKKHTFEAFMKENASGGDSLRDGIDYEKEYEKELKKSKPDNDTISTTTFAYKLNCPICNARILYFTETEKARGLRDTTNVVISWEDLQLLLNLEIDDGDLRYVYNQTEEEILKYQMIIRKLKKEVGQR